jgi:HK97 family phage major capsid protein
MTKEQLTQLIRETAGAVVAERIEAALAANGGRKSGAELISGGETTPLERRDDISSRDKGLVLGGMLISLAASKMNPERAIDHAKKTGLGDAVVKALEVSTQGAGGVLVPPGETSEVIDALVPRTAVRSLGPTMMPLDNGVLPVPRLSATVSGSYIGETDNIGKEQQAFDNVVATAKRLAVIVPISNALLRRGGPRVQSIVRNDTLRGMAITEDSKFIRSNGTQFTPRGLRYHAAAANVIAANGTVNLANVTSDLGSLVLALEEANVAFTTPGWIFAPRTKQYLMTVRDGNGNYAFREEMLRGTFWGYPFRATTQVPKNLGSGGDESEVYLADFDDLVLAEALSMSVALSEEAAYIENGSLVSAFSKDQTVMRVIAEHDFVARHDQSIAVLTEVTWEP